MIVNIKYIGCNKMDEIKNKLLENLNAMEKQCKDKAKILKEEDRDDEAIIEKIKTNIIGVFIKVFNISYKQAINQRGDDSQKQSKLIEIYSEWFNKIPANWNASLAEAEEHDDFETIYIEKEKLAMAEKIKEIFLKIVEESNV